MGTRVRRISQILFFALFIDLLLHTEFLNVSSSDGRRVYPLDLFFRLDPLAALVNMLASHAVYVGLASAIILIVPTVLLGRFFCGWICPLGSLNHFVGNIRSASKPCKKRIAANRFKTWQATKYLLLIAGLVATLWRSNMVSWIDPLSLFVRSTGISILPTAASKKYSIVYEPHYFSNILVAAAFWVLLLMNLRVTRFWCRALCPLGALLGIAARWSILDLHKDEATCNKCSRCLINCQGGDDPIAGVPWHKTECHACLNCVEACPRGSLEFRFLRRSQRPPEVVGTSLSRRRTLAAVVAGLAAGSLIHAQTLLGKSGDKKLIRPPGALNETDFLARCIRCGECMRVCPNDALHPAVTEAGLEGLWSPLVTPKIGYCEPNCVLCSEVCPTGAIRELTPPEKGWMAGNEGASAPLLIGTAIYDRELCLPWAKAIECAVCLEWCPVLPKAIYVEDAKATDEEGNPRMLKRPLVDSSRCVGCGACEFSCPLQHSGIYITSTGESRSPHH